MSGLLEGKQLVSDGTRDSNSEPTSLPIVLGIRVGWGGPEKACGEGEEQKSKQRCLGNGGL